MEHLLKITTFINDIGIPCREGNVRGDSFLPGVDIVNGEIIYDSGILLSAGDLLHEAGHVAVLKPSDRVVVTSPNVNGDLQEGGAEMAAIAWSWAALCHLNLSPDVVFHENGYKGDAESLIDNFASGRYIAVPLLQWMGMTTECKDGSTSSNCYPIMRNWLRP